MNKIAELFKRSKDFWVATGVRCARTFLTSVLSVWTAGTLVTQIDWPATLLIAGSNTALIFIMCVYAGLPEVDEP